MGLAFCAIVFALSIPASHLTGCKFAGGMDGVSQADADTAPPAEKLAAQAEAREAPYFDRMGGE